jgi:hypothetical protein
LRTRKISRGWTRMNTNKNFKRYLRPLLLVAARYPGALAFVNQEELATNEHE